ncbi:MAG: DHHA1 domain-containing protein [Thermoprotei archaeon]|jgi:RecJ-like exonuclease
MSSTYILFHGDSDGVCGAAQALMVYPDAELRITKPNRLFIDLEHLPQKSRIIIIDIALDIQIYNGILYKFKEIVQNGGEIIYIDHHKISSQLLRDNIAAAIKYVYEEGISAAELTNRAFNLQNNNRAVMLAYYGAFADYLDSTPLMESLLKTIDRRNLILEASLLSTALETMDIFMKIKTTKDLASGLRPSEIQYVLFHALLGLYYENQIYKYVEKNAKRIGQLSVVINPPYQGFLGRAAVYAMTIHNSLFGLAARYEKETVDISIRSKTNKVDLSNIAAELAKQFGGSGGGHTVAAGMRIPIETFDKFLDTIASILNRT